MNDASPDWEELQLLLDRHAAGEPAAHGALMEWAHYWLKGHSRGDLRRSPRLARFDNTSDVHQEAVIRLGEALKTIRPPNPNAFMALFSRKRRHYIIDFLRKGWPRHFQTHGNDGSQSAGGDGSGRRVEVHADSDSGAMAASGTPADEAAWNERLLKLYEAIDTLEPRQQQAVDYHFIHEMSQQESAELMGVSLATFKRTWVEARDNLGAAMEGWEE